MILTFSNYLVFNYKLIAARKPKKIENGLKSKKLVYELFSRLEFDTQINVLICKIKIN